MSKFLRNILILLLVLIIVVAVVTSLLNLSVSETPDLSLIEEAWQVIIEEHVDSAEIDPAVLSQGAIRGMIEALDDPWSSYFEPQQYENWQDTLDNAFGGIGAEVTVKDEQITIVAPLKGEPAEDAGILPGDKILEIDGESTERMNLEEAVMRIRGEPGTQVTLNILHEGEEAGEDIVITRERIQLHSVSSEMITEKIALISIKKFASRTGIEVEEALEGVLADNAEAIVLDLRNNPGGPLDEAVSVASQFLSDGIVLFALDNRDEKDIWDVKSGGLATTLPIAVLVNSGSASASEVVAGALQDRERAIIIGTTTVGKGSVNINVPLSDGSALYISIEHWYTPEGRQIDREGIIPDEIVEISQEDIELGIDTQLDRAVEYLQSDDF